MAAAKSAVHAVLPHRISGVVVDLWNWMRARSFVVRSSLVFCHNDSNGHAAGVRQAQRQPLHPKFLRNRSRTSAQSQLWPMPRLPHDLELPPAHASADTGSQRLRPSLLGCKPCRKALRRIFLATAVRNLRRREDTLQKNIPKTLNALLDAINLNQIRSKSENHNISFHPSLRTPSPRRSLRHTHLPAPAVRYRIRSTKPYDWQDHGYSTDKPCGGNRCQ